MSPSSDDDHMMRRCLELARAAGSREEVPVGAVVVIAGEVVGEGSNRCLERGTPLAHAELEALERAFADTGAGRLPQAILYSSLEPCFMCAGAALHARVQRIVFAAKDPKFGACGSLAMLPRDRRLNHRCQVDGGLMADQSGELLRRFFQRLR